MTTEDDLARVLRGHAPHAPAAARVRARSHAGVARRRRQRPLGAAGGAGLAVAGLVVGVQALAPAGDRQPVVPAAPPATTAGPAPAPGEASGVAPVEGGRAADADERFFESGYDGFDADELGELWRVEDPQLVKVLAGVRLEAGLDLPIEPGEVVRGPGQEAPQDVLAQAAYAEAGYGYDDAVELAEIWGEPDVGLVKAVAGQQLLDGVLPLPVTAP